MLLVRPAWRLGDSADGRRTCAARIGTVLLVAVVVACWVRKRDDWRRKIRQFMSEGQDYTKQQRSATMNGATVRLAVN